MDENNIYYYLVLGAIYIISRFLKKKKPPVDAPNYDTHQPDNLPDKTVNSPSSVDEILKELSKQFETPKEPEPISVIDEEPEMIPNYQEKNIEAVLPDEQIDIVAHTEIERERPKYERSSAFVIDENEENELREGVLELLANEDGMRKAVILKEILDRKY